MTDQEIHPDELDWDNAIVVEGRRLRELDRLLNDRALLHQVAADYDRRRQHWWGRFLLWLLRKTT